MPLFCPACNNLLTVITKADAFYFNCLNCHQSYKPTDEDTLRHEEVNNSKFLNYRIILQNANRDPMNPKVKKECACGHDMARQVRLGSDMKLINVCIKCNKQTIEGVDE